MVRIEYVVLTSKCRRVSWRWAQNRCLMMQLAQNVTAQREGQNPDTRCARAAWVCHTTQARAARGCQLKCGCGCASSARGSSRGPTRMRSILRNQPWLAPTDRKQTSNLPPRLPSGCLVRPTRRVVDLHYLTFGIDRVRPLRWVVTRRLYRALRLRS